jgi:hypothetical protein
MNIPVGVNGRVLNSEHVAHEVHVVDDSVNTGGFLVLERWEGPDGPGKFGWFDSWVENEATLQQFFVECDWEVQWEKQ